MALEARQEAAERLDRLAAETQLAAAEQQAVACYRMRLAQVVGRSLDELTLDDDLVNATLLTVDIKQNRRLLLKLVRAHLAGDRHWRERLPANANFLSQLAGRGVDPPNWLKTHPRGYRCTGVPGGRVRLRLEQDPLHILQMGNYFDTCLSFGGINAFSTVANARDLNKRVVYATDGAGRVVGQKLLALNDRLELVGFHTYTSLTDNTANDALRAIFLRYCTEFARRCGLRMADRGLVPTLVTRDWYDDGVVPWGESTVPYSPSLHPRPSHV